MSNLAIEIIKAKEIRNGDTAKALELIKNGCDLYERWEDRHILGYAAEYGFIDVASAIVDKGFCIDETEDNYSEGRRALHWAVEASQLDMVKFLIYNGSSIHEKFHVTTSLHVACCNKDYEIIKYLIEEGSHINEQDQEGDTPLHLICERGDIKILEYFKNLPKLDVNIANDEGQLPIHKACFSSDNSLEMIKFLISRGTDVNHKDNRGDSPLHLVCEYRLKIEIVKYLIGYAKAVPNTYNRLEENPLHKICEHIDISSIAEFLIKSSVNINSANHRDLETPLYRAAKYSDIETVKLLVESGADITRENHNGDIVNTLLNSTQEPHQKKKNLVVYF